MNCSEHTKTLSEIIEKQEKEMKDGLHKVGKFTYTIFEESIKLSKCLPHVFRQYLYPGNGVSFTNDDFSYSVDLQVGQSIELTYKGKHNFTYREIKRDENSTWKIYLCDLDDNVNASDIYSIVWNLLQYIKNYSTQNEERIKNIIENLETM